MRLATAVVWVSMAFSACLGQPVISPGSPEATDHTAITSKTSLPDGPIRGVLPDGTDYDVILEPLTNEPVTAVTAGILVDTGSGRPIPLGVVDFRPATGEDAGWHGDDLYRETAGGWMVAVRVSDAARGALGADWRRKVETGLEVSTDLDLPLVELTPPLVWAGDDQTVMEVRYETFTVRRGCDRTAAACNPTHAVGVIPLEQLLDTGSRWSYDQVWVQSYALRPGFDPHRIEPGPLAARWDHDLVWTGEEMIVWGGIGTEGDHLVDGAAFHPESGTWRMLPVSPLGDGQPTAAVWAGGELVVVSEEATVSYHPGQDTWTILGSGVTPPQRPGSGVWTGTQVVVWSPDGIHGFDPDAAMWSTLPVVDGSDAGEGVLLVLDRNLHAVASRGCATVILEWTGIEWLQLAELPPELQEGPGCHHPSQTAPVNGRLIVWMDHSHPSMAYHPGADRWETIATVPLSGMDRLSASRVLGERLMVMTASDAAIYDPGSDRWTEARLPGNGSGVDLVWTGEEVLMWSQCCYGPDDIDAWRWTPPLPQS